MTEASRVWPRPVGMLKFVLMSLFTMGLYGVYWFYWNWRRQREMENPAIKAGWRAFFSPFTAWLLFRDVHADARAKATWSPRLLAVLYFIMSMAFLIPGPQWVLTILSFITLMPVQHSINQMHAQDGEAIDTRITLANIAAMIGGVLLMLLLYAAGQMLDEVMRFYFPSQG
ncbi:MAG: hypothetical protein ABIS27_07985 [Longimicrobiales bacterium]